MKINRFLGKFYLIICKIAHGSVELNILKLSSIILYTPLNQESFNFKEDPFFQSVKKPAEHAKN